MYLDGVLPSHRQRHQRRHWQRLAPLRTVDPGLTCKMDSDGVVLRATRIDTVASMSTADEPKTAGAIVGQRVRARRNELGISRNLLHTRSGIDVSHLARIENGTSNPTVTSLVQLAVALEIDVTELVAGLGAENLPVGSQAFSEADFRRELEARAGGGRAVVDAGETIKKREAR